MSLGVFCGTRQLEFTSEQPGPLKYGEQLKIILTFVQMSSSKRARIGHAYIRGVGCFARVIQPARVSQPFKLSEIARPCA